MKRSTSVIRILAVIGAFIFANPVLQAQQGNFGTVEDTTKLQADDLNSFGQQIAGTYFATRQPTEGSSRILNLFADGNLSSIQSTQFGGGELGNSGFSNQHGTWKRIGEHEVKATVLNLYYNIPTGEFLGTAIAQYNLQFDNTFQTVTGDVKGKIFSPGVDPLNPGDTKPILEFSSDFQAKRVAVSSSDTTGN